MSQYDLLIKGGEVIDPSSGRRGRFDVAFSGEWVETIEENVDPVLAERVETADGLLVVPGLVDMHTHVFEGLEASVSADSYCLGRGSTTAVDAGSAGAKNFELFRRVTAENRTRTLAWLNLSTIGQTDTRVGELLALPYADVEAAVETANRYPDLIVGLKARLSTYAVGGTCKPVLRLLREAADAARLPVMIHVGDTGEPLAEVFEYLGPGDVVSHILTGRKHGILRGDGTIIPEVFQARRKGIILDAARGRNHVAFPVMKAAIEQGIIPDTLSTDITNLAGKDPYFSLPMMATQLMACGARLEECIAAMTDRPARAIGHDELGRLEPGGVGDATLLRLEEGDFTVEDVDGRRMQTSQRLVAVGVVRAGAYISLPPV